MIGFSQKLWIALLILSITGIASFLPLFLFRKKTLPGWLLDADYFARGVFLGVGLLHLLPEAIGHWRSAFGANATFPWVYFICALTISLLIFSENLLEMQFNQDKRDYFYLILLVSMLVIHSFFEGLALGISLALSSFLLLLFAILAHKGIAAFALGIKFQTYRVQYQYLPLYYYFYLLSVRLWVF